MRKQAIILITTLILTIIFCGGVSAVSTSNNNTIVVHSSADKEFASVTNSNSNVLESIANISGFSRQVNSKGEIVNVGVYQINKLHGDRVFIAGGLPGSGKEMFYADDALRIDGPNGEFYHSYEVDYDGQQPGEYSTNPNIKNALYWHNPQEITNILKDGDNEITLTIEDIYGGAIGITPSLLIYKMTLGKPDLAINLDYQKYVQNEPSINKDNIYGTDKVHFIIKVTNKGPGAVTDINVNFKLPSEFKFISDIPSNAYDDYKGIWKINSLKDGETKTLYVTALAVKNGETKLEVSIPSIGDPNTDNNVDNATIHIHNPVVLVHGFGYFANTSDWNSLISKFEKYGITYCNFPYSGTKDPYAVAVNEFTPWMANLQKKYNYKGKFDIVCHSMGALVTRYYMENNGNKNAKYIGQWIGLGPVNRGAAVEDILVHPTLNLKIFLQLHSNGLYNFIHALIPEYSPAALNMQTTTTHIIDLNKDGIASNVKYRLILGRNVQQIPGVNTVEKSGKTYRFTTQGDGIVANAQSMLSGAASTVYVQVKHTGLPNSNQVQNLIINYLKNT